MTIVYVSSATEAVKTKHLLSNSNIKSRIIKRTVTNSGCNFALEIKSANIYDVAMVLRNSGIKYTIKNDDLPR